MNSKILNKKKKIAAHIQPKSNLENEKMNVFTFSFSEKKKTKIFCFLTYFQKILYYFFFKQPEINDHRYFAHTHFCSSLPSFLLHPSYFARSHQTIHLASISLIDILNYCCSWSCGFREIFDLAFLSPYLKTPIYESLMISFGG